MAYCSTRRCSRAEESKRQLAGFVYLLDERADDGMFMREILPSGFGVCIWQPPAAYFVFLRILDRHHSFFPNDIAASFEYVPQAQAQRHDAAPANVHAAARFRTGN